MNVLNELRSLLGPLYDSAVTLGGIGMFGAPVLAFLALKGSFTQDLEYASQASHAFRVLGSAAAVLTGIVWLGALLSIFPGVFACSVYCFLGIALPILGLSIGVAVLLLLAGSLTSKSNAPKDNSERTGQ